MTEAANRGVRDWVWWLLVALAVAPLVLCELTSSDAWFHAHTGRWIFENHTAPDFSKWYFTPTRVAVPDLRWTCLGDVIFFFAARGGAAGMTLLSAACLALGLWLLRRLWAGPMNGWVATVLMAVTFGSYQLQLARNAVFSLPLLAAVFVAFTRSRRDARWHFAWPILFGLWGILHGSAALGLAVATLLVVGGWVDRFAEKSGGLRREILGSAAALGVAALLALGGNPTAVDLLKKPVQKSPPAAVSAAPVDLKWRLNHLIWNPDSVGVMSGDFASPFDRFDYRPVPFSLAMAAAALAWLALARGWRVAWLVGSAAVFFLALCYFRMAGYAAVAAGAVFLGVPRGALRISGAPIAVCAGVFLIGSALFGRMDAVIGKATHVAGLGASPQFDDAVCDAMLAPEFTGDEAFTTIASGSHALWRWAGRRRVFVDGFFAPHERSIWKDYAAVRDGASPDTLVEKYGARLALIEHERNDFSTTFLSAPSWRPVLIGKGAIVFAHRTARAYSGGLRVLASWDEARKMNDYFRQRLASNYYGALVSLALAGEVDSVRRAIAQDPALFAGLESDLAPSQRLAVVALKRILENAQ